MKFVRDRGHGRVLPAPHARDPRAGRLGVHGPLRRPRPTGTSSAASSRTCTPTDAYRGAGRPEATYVIERIVDAFARKVGKDPAEVRRMNLHPPFAEAPTAICGLNVDSANYEPHAGQGAGAGRTTTRCARSRRRGATAATRSSSASGSRTYIEMCGLAPSQHPRRPPLRGRRLGRRHDRVPAHGQGRREDRHLAARPGPRDDVVADRGRRPRRRHATTSRSCTATRMITPLGHGHVRLAVALGGRRGDALRDGEGQGEGPDDRGARAGGRRGGPRLGRRHVRA